jgi:murein DD-endopeptidase MepM/ murein hydrolase activator NlpD
MAKVKYRFNPESLSFDKVRTSFKVWIIKAFTFFTASIVISIIYYIIFSYFFDSPKEKALVRVNEQMKLQYELTQKRINDMSSVLDDIQQRDDNIYRIIFEAEPIPKSIREAGFGGVNRYEALEKATNSELVAETVKKLDIISKRLYVQSKSYDEVIEKAMNKEHMLACLPGIQPVSNENLKRTSSGWGWRIHPLYKIRQFHSGQDFAAPIGTDVYSTADGTVEKVESSTYSGYGNCIVIDHGFGYQTLYGHLSRFNVKVGQKVKRGNIIGFVGNTGFSTGPHLHYEVIKNGEKVNPVNFFFNDLSAEQFDEVIRISGNGGQTLD